ncbi:hypothetical protein VTN02DRAFT_6618 [Thermoascus thermophilus]
MVSFSSSVINKSGKKFAPKAPARRPGPGASTAPAAARPSADRQATAQTAQPTTEAAAAPEPTPTATTTPTPTTTTTPAPAPEPPSVTEAQGQPREPEPAPEKPKATPAAETPIAVPIPAPKRKASVSAQAPSPAAAQPTPHPAPPESNVPPAEPPAPEPPARRDSATAVGDQRRVEAARETQAPPVPSPAGDEPTLIRPAKRLKTSEAAAPAERAQAIAPTLITPPSTQPDVPEPGEPARTENDTVPPTAPAATTAQKKTTKPRKRRTAEDGAGEGAAGTPRERKPRARKKREPTPEGAELIEIAPSVVKMSDLCKDLRTGKKSKREMELQNLEMAELERKQKQREERRDSTDQVPIKQNGEGSPSLDRLPQRKPQAGPKMRIVNGEIVLDAASLQVDRHADAEREAGELEDVVENPLTRKINQATYGKRTKTESWDEEMTDLFYRGLRMFGTDFMMISKMFPGRSRRHIKLKFNNEERKDPERIKDALLGPREHIDIATYSEMTNTVYDDPKVIQQELDEEKKRIEDQHAKEQEAAQSLMRNPSGGGDSAAPEKGNGVNGKGRGRNGKKQVLKSMGGGTEEVVGTIDDFPMPA